MAATYGPPELIKLLLNSGADVRATDVRGMNSLMLALSTDRFNPETVKILKASGVDIAQKK